MVLPLFLVIVSTAANRSTENAVFSVASADVFRPVNGSVLRAPAEYKITSGSQFFWEFRQQIVAFLAHV